MQPRDLIGDYVIVRKIGEGGMSLVYLAERVTDHAPVVVKQLRHELAFDRRLVDRFVQSAQIMRELRHPHLARVVDYLERDGQYFVIEEYLSGGSLADRLDRGERFSEREGLVWCRDALRGVNYAHENGIVHRDLKPGNLMLDGRGRVKVTDFGIARVFGGERLTRTGREMGTPSYMSPEQIRSPLDVDHLTDVYSMGVVLYEVLTQRAPFTGNSDFAIKSQVVREPPVPPREFNPRLSADVERVVLKAMAKDPADRFGGCAEFALEVDRCLTIPERQVVQRHEPPPVHPSELDSGSQQIERRLAAVERHPEYPALLKLRPSAMPYYFRFFFIALFGLIFTAVGVVILSFVLSF